MSQITENTIVFNPKNAKNILTTLHADSNVCNIKHIYGNEQIAIFIFDCNGQPLSLENEELLIMETCDGGIPYTQAVNSKGVFKDNRIHCVALLKRYIKDETILREVRRMIKYS